MIDVVLNRKSKKPNWAPTQVQQKYIVFRTANDRPSLNQQLASTGSEPSPVFEGPNMPGNATIYRKGEGTIYTNPAFDKEVGNAELYRRDTIYPTKLDKSLDDRIGSPYVRVGSNQSIERGEAAGAGVLHKRRFPGAVLEQISAYQQKTNPDIDRAKQQLQNFKSDYALKIKEREGFNNVGMLNDTKSKEQVDLLAEGNETEIVKYLNKSNSDEGFEENSKIKYEKRYENKDSHLKDRKIPDYGGSPELKQDIYNLLYPVPEENKYEKGKWDEWDFIPLVFHDITNQEYLPFRAMLNSLSDQADAQWTETKYLGRADAVHTYEGFTRTVSLDTTLVAMSLEELHPMWQKINYLVGLTKPAGYTDDVSTNTSALDATRFIIPPFIKFNLGDMYRHQPCFIQSVGLTIPQEASWELTRDTGKNTYQYLNGTITKEDVLVGQYPEMAQLTISLRFLEKRLPKTKNRHFGHSASEDEVFGAIDEGGDRTKGFNYNLIYPNPQNPVPVQQGIDGSGDGETDDGELANADGDEFEGSKMCSPKPTPCAPSKFTMVGGEQVEKDQTKQTEEMRLWQQSACDCMGMKLGTNTGGTSGCTWTDGYIEIVDGKNVPPGEREQFNMNCREDPIDLEEIKPPLCPYPLGSPGERDYKNRRIGRSRPASGTSLSQKMSEKKDNLLKERNFQYWVHDLTNYLAETMTQPKMGRNVTYNKTKGHVSKVTSSNGNISVEFNKDGNPYSYNGVPIDPELMMDFDITCTDEQLKEQAPELRELAGAIEPRILLDVTNDNSKLFLDASKGHIITPDNYNNTEQIKSWLAEWVQKELASTMARDLNNEELSGITQQNPTFTPSAKATYVDLSGDWSLNKPIETENIYYVPFEQDKEVQIIANKFFPADPEYVSYETMDVDGTGLNLGLHPMRSDFVELKFGFFAVVSRENLEVAGSPAERNLQTKAANYLYRRLFDQNNEEADSITFEINEKIDLSQGIIQLNAVSKTNAPLIYTSSDDSVASIAGNMMTLKNAGEVLITVTEQVPMTGQPPSESRLVEIVDDVDPQSSKGTSGLSNQSNSGGNLKHMDGSTSDASLLEQVDPTWADYTRKKSALENAQLNLDSEKNVRVAIKDETIAVENYNIVGDWNEVDEWNIVQKMANMDYQVIIKKHDANGASRINLENLIFFMDDPTSEGERIAIEKYRNYNNAGETTQVDPDRVKRLNLDNLQKIVDENIELVNEAKQAVMASDPSDNVPYGVLFGDDDSRTSSIPWIYDHEFEKIEFVEDGDRAIRQSLEVPEPLDRFNVEVPQPKTDSPTPNKKPTWTWDPIPEAYNYEVTLKKKGEVLLGPIQTSSTSYTPEEDLFVDPKFKASSYTLFVRAAAKSPSSTTEWSRPGMHTVDINMKSQPPEPPRCPYAVLGVQKKDKYGRLVGLSFEGEDEGEAIKRNTLMWMGDVTSYIAYTFDATPPSFPANFQQVEWQPSSTGGDSLSVYERQTLSWEFAGEDIRNLGYDFDGNEILNAQPKVFNGMSIEGMGFDFTCVIKACTGGSNIPDPPRDGKLDTPVPTSESNPTSNERPVFTWNKIRGANRYKAELTKFSSASAMTGRTASSYKEVISYSDQTTASPKVALKDGEYEIKVTAEKLIDNQIAQTSNTGHFTIIIDSGLKLRSPEPTASSPTNNDKPTWNWDAINDAESYLVEVRKMELKNTDSA